MFLMQIDNTYEGADIQKFTWHYQKAKVPASTKTFFLLNCRYPKSELDR